MSTEKTNEELPKKDVEMSDEEIAILRAETIKFYNEQLEILRPQSEYENLLATIEESRLRRTNAIMRHAQLKMGPPKPPTPQDLKDSGRKLKKT